LSNGIRKFYTDIYQTYERVNHVLTFGLDILWRKKAAGMAAVHEGHIWLDICSGTGEMALYLHRISGGEKFIIAADFSLPMLSKIKEKPDGASIRFTMTEALTLPFRDNTLDLVTISFGTRNIDINREILIQTFGEFHRVLKPGGWFINLETSQPPVKFIRFMYHTYVRLVVKPIGTTLSGEKSPYLFLSKTIRNFYDALELNEIILQAGFSEADYKRLFLGVAAVHKAVK
jgi:demethylmenaquinone methyltransferase/2-methoxy-6-polyprenyl-1,4-benzoquinol methylase